MKKILWSAVLLLAVGLAYWQWRGLEEPVTYQNGYPDLRGRHIVVYVSCRDEVGKAFLELFKDKTGCSYEYLKMTTPEALSRIRAEREHPKADIFIGGQYIAGAWARNSIKERTVFFDQNGKELC